MNRLSQFIALTGLLIMAQAGCDGGSSQTGSATSQQQAAKAVAPLTPQEIEDHLIAAQQYFDGGELIPAEAILQELIERAPDNINANEMLAQVLYHRGARAAEENRPKEAAMFFSEAYRRYERVVELEPNEAGWRQNAGDFAFVAGRIDDAITHYRAAAEFDPTNPRHPLWEAQLLLQKGEVDEAEAAAKRALALEPNLANAIATLAAIEQQRGNFDASIELIREARSVARPEESANLRIMEARFHRLHADPDTALQLLLTLPAEARLGAPATEEIALSYAARDEHAQAVLAWAQRYEQSGEWRAALAAAAAALEGGSPAEAGTWLAIAANAGGEQPEIAALRERIEAEANTSPQD